MFFNNFDRPKNGHTLKVIGVGRISTDHQDELSLGDQEALYREHLRRILPEGTKFELTVIKSRGSGQILDRAEFIQLCEMVESGEYDIVIAEDLGRIVRRMRAYIFCEEAEDAATRVIAINDYVDTKDEGWRQATFFASFKHESFCRETSKRIRRTLRNRFREGGIFQYTIYGYIKPHSGATDDEVTKDPDAEAIYDHWFTLLEDGANYREVADWLNDLGVPTGDYCRTDEWTGAMVKRLTFTPLLKGERRRNERITKRVNKTGRPKTVPAPESEKLSRIVPHLAFIEPERYDRVIRMLKQRNAKYKRAESVVNDPRAGIPKRHTRFPGQHLRCGVCGRLFVLGGHGRKERLMCNGAREHKCWNAMTVSGPDVAAAVGTRLRELVRELPEFDSTWVEEYEAQRDALLVDHNSQLGELQKKLSAETRKLENLVAGLAQAGTSDAIVRSIRQSEEKVGLLRDEVFRIERDQQNSPSLPTLDEIRNVADEAFDDMTAESPEFGRLMRSVVEDFFVLPYRLADGGEVQPRVVFRASLGGLLGSQLILPIMQFDCEVDLAKRPKRLRFLDPVVNMVADGMKHQDIADQLGIFKTEVGYAMRLHRAMKALGTNDPWVPVTSIEQVIDCYKRVRNPRFKFEPLPGFETTRHRAA